MNRNERKNAQQIELNVNELKNWNEIIKWDIIYQKVLLMTINGREGEESDFFLQRSALISTQIQFVLH